MCRGQRAAGPLSGTWSRSTSPTLSCPSPALEREHRSHAVLPLPRLAALSEAPDVDGERSFWSTGPGGRLCTREDVAALRTEGLPAFPFPQGELFLFFPSDVVSDSTEIIIVFNQEILHVKIITEQCF